MENIQSISNTLDGRWARLSGPRGHPIDCVFLVIFSRRQQNLVLKLSASSIVEGRMITRLGFLSGIGMAEDRILSCGCEKRRSAKNDEDGCRCATPAPNCVQNEDCDRTQAKRVSMEQGASRDPENKEILEKKRLMMSAMFVWNHERNYIRSLDGNSLRNWTLTDHIMAIERDFIGLT
jgi:hypothetical protein